MFGFGKSKFKAMAARMIGQSIVRGEQITMLLPLEHPELGEVAQNIRDLKPGLWARTLAVACLVHNLQIILTQYLVENPAGIKNEYAPVLNFIMRMMPNYPKL